MSAQHTPGPWKTMALWGRASQPSWGVYREIPGTIAEWMRGPSGRELRFRSEAAAAAAIAKATGGQQ